MLGQPLPGRCSSKVSYRAGYLCWGIPEECRGPRVETVFYSKMPYSKNPYRHYSLSPLRALRNPVSTSEIFPARGYTNSNQEATGIPHLCFTGLTSPG